MADVNQASLELYRAESREELMQGIPQIFSEESYIDFIGALEAVAEGRRGLESEKTHRRLDGSTVYVQLRWRAAPGSEDDYSRVLVSISDVTALKQAQEGATAASRAKSEFLANMSHEVRTPLSGVMGMLQLMKMTSLDEEQSEYVSNALLSTRNLNTILSDILDLSKIEAGRMDIEETPFDVQDLFNEIYGAFVYQFEEKGLLLALEIHPDTPKTLEGDSARLRQVLFNLVGNAVKFTEKGGVSVSVTPLQMPLASGEARLPYLHCPPGRVRLLFAVSDTGSGMPDDEVGTIFDAFAQAGGAYVNKKKGVGLGLRIVREFVRLMGGGVSVAGGQGQGATMYFTADLKLPEQDAAQPAVAAAAQAGQDAPEKNKGGDGNRLLVVDDDAMSLVSVSHMLEKSGYQVSVADSGREALEILEETPHDLVLLDVQMPGMDGLETTGRIQEMLSDAGRPAPPIVAMTAHAMRGDREKCLRAGMNDYLAKPVLWEDLAALLDAHLATRSG